MQQLPSLCPLLLHFALGAQSDHFATMRDSHCLPHCTTETETAFVVNIASLFWSSRTPVVAAGVVLWDVGQNGFIKTIPKSNHRGSIDPFYPLIEFTQRFRFEQVVAPSSLVISPNEALQPSCNQPPLSVGCGLRNASTAGPHTSRLQAAARVSFGLTRWKKPYEIVPKKTSTSSSWGAVAAFLALLEDKRKHSDFESTMTCPQLCRVEKPKDASVRFPSFPAPHRQNHSFLPQSPFRGDRASQQLKGFDIHTSDPNE